MRTSFTGRTAWARNLAAPVRAFLSTETGGAAALVGATVLALIWANAPGWHTYVSVWATRLSIHLGSDVISASLRQWVNQGLMTLFFLVVGLEARRELEAGELRQRDRLVIPAVAAACGMLLPVLIFLAFNAGGPGAHGWGVAMSSDTAFALGALALIAPRTATRLRVFLVTASVFDDLGGLIVIASVYSSHLHLLALGIALALFLLFAAGCQLPLPLGQLGPIRVVLGVGVWLAMFESGVDPVIAGLALGLVTRATGPSRQVLERVAETARAFREQPTAELAVSARQTVGLAVAPNERLQYALHPWVSFAIVPLFALANAGVHLGGGLIGDAITSPITLGIVVGYVVGKPLGILLGSTIASRPALRGRRPTISWPVMAGGGAVMGIGFTVSVLIANLAFRGRELAEAKLGALVTIVLAPIVAKLVLSAWRRMPLAIRARQISGTAEDILDLDDDVDLEIDHWRGPPDALVTIVEYGDFECPFCGQAEPVIRELLSRYGDELRYVWRHLPLSDVHPTAQLAAEASEAASAQGRFWEMYELLLAHDDGFTEADLDRFAAQLELDRERFWDDMRRHVAAERIARDVASADASGVTGTPSFFINRRRHWGAYDVETLSAAVSSARSRASLLAVARG